MKIVSFWSNWPLGQRRVYLAALAVFGIAVGYFLFQYFVSPKFVIQWTTETDIETVRTVFDHYRVGLYTFPIHVENYVLLQNFLPTEMMVVQWTAIVFLLFTGLAVVMILALSSTLRKSYYIISMVLLAAFFVYLKTDYLQLFGSYNKAGIIAALALFFPASYYFNFYRAHMPLHQRFSIFLGLMVVYATFLLVFAEAPSPVLHLSNYGIYPALVVSIIFIFMIGHEPISAFLHVITGSGIRGSKNLMHFFIISLIYLLNVLLVYLRNSRDLDLNIYMINSYWLLIFSAMIGIWGYRRRSPTYAGMFPFHPTGALLYLSLGTICFATIAYLMAGANDSLLETMEDAITFSQLGYGAMFILYVIANFYTMLHNNLNIGKIVFKPSRMPYFISKFAGIIVILGLFLRANLVPFYQAISGYNSGLGDIYYYNGDYPSAKEYYKIASNYSTTSHRANFALASIEERENNISNALLYYLQSVIKNPTEFAYAKTSRIYWLKNRYFDAIFSLREGLDQFSTSGYLYNNLGILYAKTDITDSTLFFLDRAQQQRPTRSIALANKLAVLNLKIETLDHMADLRDLADDDYLPALNNKLIYAGMTGQTFSPKGRIVFEPEMKNNTEQIIYNYNKAVLNPMDIDSTFNIRMETYYDSVNMTWMHDPLKLASALVSYKQGDKHAAFGTLNYLAARQDNSNPYYNQILGKLALASGAPQLAADYFESAARGGYRDILPEMAFSYMESGNHERAAIMWGQILQLGDTTYHALAGEMLQILAVEGPRDMIKADANSKYHFLRYRQREFDPLLIEGLILTFNNDNYKAMAYLDLTREALGQQDPEGALQQLYKLEKLNINSPDILNIAREMYIRLNIMTGDTETLEQLVNSPDNKKFTGKTYALARLYLAACRDNNPAVTSRFEATGTMDPFDEEAVIQSAIYFDNRVKDDEKAYDILLSAININPYSQRINEAYILQCLEVGLDSYATEALEKYRQIVSETTYLQFMNTYTSAKEMADSTAGSW